MLMLGNEDTSLLRTNHWTNSMHSYVCVTCLLYPVQGVVIVYDVTNPDSFAHLSKWVHDIATVSFHNAK